MKLRIGSSNGNRNAVPIMLTQRCRITPVASVIRGGRENYYDFQCTKDSYVNFNLKCGISTILVLVYFVLNGPLLWWKKIKLQNLSKKDAP